MSNKAAAVWHGAVCPDGACCKNPHRVCAHGHACQFHLREEVQRIKAEKESSAAIEFRKAWM